MFGTNPSRTLGEGPGSDGVRLLAGLKNFWPAKFINYNKNESLEKSNYKRRKRASKMQAKLFTSTFTDLETLRQIAIKLRESYEPGSVLGNLGRTSPKTLTDSPWGERPLLRGPALDSKRGSICGSMYV